MEVFVSHLDAYLPSGQGLPVYRSPHCQLASITRRGFTLLVQVKRQWDIAQCTMDAIDAARAVAGLGLTLDLLSRPGAQVTC